MMSDTNPTNAAVPAAAARRRVSLRQRKSVLPHNISNWTSNDAPIYGVLGATETREEELARRKRLSSFLHVQSANANNDGDITPVPTATTAATALSAPTGTAASAATAHARKRARRDDEDNSGANAMNASGTDADSSGVSPHGVADLNTSTDTDATANTTVDSDTSVECPPSLRELLNGSLYGYSPGSPVGGILEADDGDNVPPPDTTRLVATKADANNISASIDGITAAIGLMSVKLDAVHDATVGDEVSIFYLLSHRILLPTFAFAAPYVQSFGLVEQSLIRRVFVPRAGTLAFLLFCAV